MILLNIYLVIYLVDAENEFLFFRFDINLNGHASVNLVHGHIQILIKTLIIHGCALAFAFIHRFSLHFSIRTSHSKTNIWHIIGLSFRLLKRWNWFWIPNAQAFLTSYMLYFTRNTKSHTVMLSIRVHLLEELEAWLLARLPCALLIVNLYWSFYTH